MNEIEKNTPAGALFRKEHFSGFYEKLNFINMKNLYEGYSQEVQNYMQNVIQCLQEDYGKIPTSWRISLDLIADNVDIYLKAKKALDKEGLIGTDSLGRKGKNPNVSIMNVALRTIMDLIKSFALTPMSKSKMKAFNSEAQDAEDYIDYLTN